MKLTVATRGSALALWQTNWVIDRLREHHGGGLEVEILTIRTQGDRQQDVPIYQIGGKGIFVKEIEQALLDDTADFAVHSLKDMPGEQPLGLAIAAVPEREDPRDALLRHDRPDLRVEMLRGNLDTRLRKLDEGQFDAAVLAAAGLRRLGYGHRVSVLLPSHHFVPCAGQGALAIEARQKDEPVRA